SLSRVSREDTMTIHVGTGFTPRDSFAQLNAGGSPLNVVGVWGIAGAVAFVKQLEVAGLAVSAGVLCPTDRGTGVLGTSDSGAGVHGTNGVSGFGPTGGVGVWGDSLDGFGVYGSSANSKAGFFDGDVQVAGRLDAENINVTGDITLQGGADI